MTINKGKTSYFPNTVGDGKPRPASAEEGGYVHYMEKVEGKIIRSRSEKFKDFSARQNYSGTACRNLKKNIL